MKTKLRTLFAIIILTALAACASGPGYKDVAAEISDLEPGNGRIYFYRTAIVGAAIQPSIRVNEEVVGKAKPKGFFYIDRPADSYVIATSTEAKRSLSLLLEEGKEMYVRLDLQMGFMVGHIKPVLVEPAE
jgi:hypothetical protein